VHGSQFGSDAFPPARFLDEDFLVAKRRSAGVLPVTAVPNSLAGRAGLRHRPFMPYPKDRSTPRAASSSPSGPTMIIVETP
jgi:hypothetical protein